MTGKKVVLNDREYVIYGEAGPCFVYGVDTRDPDEISEIYDRIRTDKPFMMAGVVADNWDDEFSPWEAPGVRAGQSFGGQGDATLRRVFGDLIRYLENNYPQAGPFIATGYSLAGLWALWAFLGSEKIAGCVCGSGSLWFPLWDQYVTSHVEERDAKVYLSLGEKEEKARGIMGSVGDNTRLTYRLLAEKGINCKLEMNPGGHFANVPERMAKGIEWYLGDE